MSTNLYLDARLFKGLSVPKPPEVDDDVTQQESSHVTPLRGERSTTGMGAAGTRGGNPTIKMPSPSGEQRNYYDPTKVTVAKSGASSSEHISSVVGGLSKFMKKSLEDLVKAPAMGVKAPTANAPAPAPTAAGPTATPPAPAPTAAGPADTPPAPAPTAAGPAATPPPISEHPVQPQTPESHPPNVGPVAHIPHTDGTHTQVHAQDHKLHFTHVDQNGKNTVSHPPMDINDTTHVNPNDSGGYHLTVPSKLADKTEHAAVPLHADFDKSGATGGRHHVSHDVVSSGVGGADHLQEIQGHLGEGKSVIVPAGEGGDRHGVHQHIEDTLSAGGDLGFDVHHFPNNDLHLTPKKGAKGKGTEETKSATPGGVAPGGEPDSSSKESREEWSPDPKHVEESAKHLASVYGGPNPPEESRAAAYEDALRDHRVMGHPETGTHSPEDIIAEHRSMAGSQPELSHTDNTGTIETDSGTWEGSHKDGVPHGEGTQKSSNWTWKGTFKDGRPHTGVETSDDGKTVIEMRDGKRFKYTERNRDTGWTHNRDYIAGTEEVVHDDGRRRYSSVTNEDGTGTETQYHENGNKKHEVVGSTEEIGGVQEDPEATSTTWDEDGNVVHEGLHSESPFHRENMERDPDSGDLILPSKEDLARHREDYEAQKSGTVDTAPEPEAAETEAAPAPEGDTPDAAPKEQETRSISEIEAELRDNHNFTPEDLKELAAHVGSHDHEPHAEPSEPADRSWTTHSTGHATYEEAEAAAEGARRTVGPKEEARLKEAAEKPTPYDDPTIEPPSDLTPGQQEFEERKNVETRIRPQKDGTFNVKSREEVKEAPEESQEHRDILAGTLRDLDSLTESNQQTRPTPPEPEVGAQHTDDSGTFNHDGGVFEGSHKGRVPQEGKITYGDDGSTFEGKFTEDGNWHTGTHTTANGTVTEYTDAGTGTRTSFHPNGQKRSEGPVVDHERDGTWRHYNEDGSPSSIGEYEGGKANGEWTHFHSNGGIAQEGEYRNHKQVGEHRYYDENGNHEGSNLHNEDGEITHTGESDGSNVGPYNFDTPDTGEPDTSDVAPDTGADPKSDLPPVSEMDDDALNEELKGYGIPFDPLAMTALLRDRVEEERANRAAPEEDTPDAGEPEDPRDFQDMSHEELAERAIADENVPQDIKATLREMPPADANWDDKFAFIERMMKNLADNHEKNRNKTDWYALGKAMMVQDPFDALENWYGAFKQVAGNLGQGFREHNDRKNLEANLKNTMGMNVPRSVFSKTNSILNNSSRDSLAGIHGDLANTAGDISAWNKDIHEGFQKKYAELERSHKSELKDAENAENPEATKAAINHAHAHTLDGVLRQARIKNNAENGLFHPHTTATEEDHDNFHAMLSRNVGDTSLNNKEKFFEIVDKARNLSSEHLNEFRNILNQTKDKSPEERQAAIEIGLTKLLHLEDVNEEARQIASAPKQWGPNTKYPELGKYSGPQNSSWLDLMEELGGGLTPSEAYEHLKAGVDGVEEKVEAAGQQAEEQHEANKQAESEATGGDKQDTPEEGAEEEIAPTFGENLNDPQEGDTSLSFDHALKPDHNVGRGYRDHNGDGHYIRSKHVDKDGTVSYLVERINPNYLPGSPDEKSQNKFLHEKQSAEKLHRNMASGGDYKPSQVLWHGNHATNDRHASDSYNAELAEIKKRNDLPSDFNSATREQQIRSGAFSESDKKYGKTKNSDQTDKKASGGTRTKLSNPKHNVGTGYVDETGNEFYIKDWFFDKDGEKDFYKVESISEDIGTNKEDTVEVDVVDRRLRSGDYQGKELAWHDDHAGRHPEGHISKEELARVDSARKDYHQERFSKKDEAAAARATLETPTDASKKQAAAEAPPASPPVGDPSEGAPPAAAGADPAGVPSEGAPPAVPGADPVEATVEEAGAEVTPEGVTEEGVAAEEVPGEEGVVTEEVTDDIADATPPASGEADPEVEGAEAVEDATEEVAPRRADLEGHAGDDTELQISAGPSTIDKHPVQYRVVEMDDITPSHKVSAGNKFIKHENYPEGVQPRKYSGADARNVIERATNYEPGRVMSLGVGTEEGPPIVTKDGIVLGGNSRAMTMGELYRSGRGDVIRDHLMENASKFGLDPETIKSMKNPGLVRVMSDVHSQDMSPENLNTLASQMNDQGTMAYTTSEEHTDLAKKLDKSKILDALVKDFDLGKHKNATHKPFLGTKSGKKFLSKLEGALGASSPKYIENEELKSPGQELLSGAIAAHLVGDKEVYGRLLEKPKSKLSAIAFPSLFMSKHPSGHDLSKELKLVANAIDGIETYKSTLKDDNAIKSFNQATPDDKLDLALGQLDLLSKPHEIFDNPRARALYNLIQNENQTALKKTFEKMAELVSNKQPKEQMALAPDQTTDELLALAYQDATKKVLANEYQNTETGEDSYWGPPTEPVDAEAAAAEVEDVPTPEGEDVPTPEAEVAETPTEDVETEEVEVVTPTEDVETEESITETGPPEEAEVEDTEWSATKARAPGKIAGYIDENLGEKSPYSEGDADKWSHQVNESGHHKVTSPDGAVVVSPKRKKNGEYTKQHYTVTHNGEEEHHKSFKAAMKDASEKHQEVGDDIHKGGGGSSEHLQEANNALADALGADGTGCI